MGHFVPLGRLSACILALVSVTNGCLRAAEPLHLRIDRAVEAKLQGEPAAIATDGEFLRRVSLDLGGIIPDSTEARAFLDDPSPYKRERVVDRLLASRDYARRMQVWFDVMLMERRDDLHVPGTEWRAYLRRAFADNTPYNHLVALILSADGTDAKTRPAAKFFLDRGVEPTLLTRDIGRMFLGRDFQCNQCHDHPLIDDYKQAHYYGIFAYVSRTSLFKNGEEPAVLAEKGEGEVTFTSVFKKKLTHKTGPRILDEKPLDEAVVAKGAEYLIAPDQNGKVRPIPRVSRRSQLAPELTSGAVPEFNRNVVNRLWALMMGRGLVHPLDMHHSENPPTDPELLDLLANEFLASSFDVKRFLRQLALSRTYQRSSEPPPKASPSEEISAREGLGVAAMKPLSPEQMAWSVMQGLGLVASVKQQVEQRLDGADARLRTIFQSDPKRQALRASMIDEAVDKELEQNASPIVQRFAAAAGQPQDANDPTVHQALFLSNGPTVQAWLAPSGTNLTSRLAALTEDRNVAEELYLSLYSRRPTEEECVEVKRYLAGRGSERLPALQELVWAALASTEFRFNH